LRSVNALVMQKRLDKKPGEWKDKPNQAGSTFFVVPELVPGTLREGFSRIEALAHPLARAVMTMFVVTEVHPFIDGNGRTARLAMNCMLSAQKLSRIIIPTVYREDYLLPLKALSHHREAQPLVAALSRIQRWSGAFEYARPRSDVRDQLGRCNAVGTLRPWCFVRMRSVSKSVFLSLRFDANNSEAALKSIASESRSGPAGNERWIDLQPMLGDANGGNLMIGHAADFHIGPGQSLEIGYLHRKKASESFRLRPAGAR
jgi:hypothetical protein